jgi:hypothetical protein
MVTGPLRLFLSYAHEDATVADDLRRHLAPLRHERIIVDWYDRDLVAGSDWDDSIKAKLESADLVVVLVSADFLASSYAYGVELARAMELHRSGTLRLVPVIVRNCRWQRLPLATLHVLPQDGRPIDAWDRRDDAFVSVVVGIEAAARVLLSTADDLINEWLTSRLLRRRVIREVQRLLADLGLYDHQVDGEPGPRTERAVHMLQVRAGLTADARIGPEVLRYLSAGR